MSLWSEERKQEAIRLKREGYSASETAALLGKGLTRNAIIGLWHRSGLSNPGTNLGRKYHEPRNLKREAELRQKVKERDAARQARRSAEKRGLSVPKPKQERKMNVPIVRPIPEVIEHNPNPTPLSLATDSQCRFIEGEPVADALICGGIVKQGSSYCCHHHARVFTILVPSKRREPISTYRAYVRAA